MTTPSILPRACGAVLAAASLLTTAPVAQAQPTSVAQPVGDPAAIDAAADTGDPQSSGDLERAREVFRAAAEAVRRARGMTFSVKAYAEGGSIAQYTPRLDAQVAMARDGSAPGTPFHVRVFGTGKPGGTGATEVTLDVAWLGSTLEWVDHEARAVTQRAMRQARHPSLSIAASGKIDQLAGNRPFERELNATTAQFEGEQEVAGVMCQIITLRSGDRGPRTRYAMGLSDNLPRRIERILDAAGMGGTVIVEINGLSVHEDETVGLEAVRVAVPEGYTEDRQGVPAINPTPTPTPTPSSTTPTATPQPDRTTTPPPEDLSAPEEPKAPPPPPRLSIGSVAPAFDLKGPNGAAESLESLRGKVGVLLFVGSWCLPCSGAMTDLGPVASALSARGVRTSVVAVRERSSAGPIAEMDAALPPDGEHRKAVALLLDGDAAARAFEITHYPTAVVISPEGTIELIEGPWETSASIDRIRAAAEAAAGRIPPPQP